MDLIEAVRETTVVMEVYRQEREDDLVWDAIFREASDMASEFQVSLPTSVYIHTSRTFLSIRTNVSPHSF